MNVKLMKEKRKELRYSQQQIADILGVSRVSYARWESGKSEPLGAHLEKLEKFLKVKLVD